MPLENSGSTAAFAHDFEDNPGSVRKYDFNGWPEIKRNPISKVGVYPYKGRNISPQLEPDQTYMVYRPAEELSKTECIESFKLVPWVDLHPTKGLLGPESVGRVPAEQKGIEGVTGENVEFDPDTNTLYANIKLFSDNLGEKIDDGVRELSIGYACKYELSSGVYNGQHYDAIQRNIRGNHLASVPAGRMGPEVAVLDHLTFTMDAKDIEMTEEEKKMQECKDRATKDGFSRYSKDAAEEEKEQKEKEEKESADKAAKDAAEEEKKKEKEAADKAAKDSDDKDKDTKEKDGEAMDAQIADLTKRVQKAEGMTFKAMLGEMNRRNALAQRVSEFVGAFDHAEMTTEEVAQYAVKKIGLQCASGAEVAVLDGYLHDRKAPSSSVSFAIDSAGGDSVDASEIQNFYNTAA